MILNWDFLHRINIPNSERIQPKLLLNHSQAKTPKQAAAQAASDHQAPVVITVITIMINVRIPRAAAAGATACN